MDENLPRNKHGWRTEARQDQFFEYCVEAERWGDWQTFHDHLGEALLALATAAALGHKVRVEAYEVENYPINGPKWVTLTTETLHDYVHLEQVKED
jgi:hypothetical protein